MRQLKRHRLKLLALCGAVSAIGSGFAVFMLAASLPASLIVVASVGCLAVIGLYVAWQLERRTNLELKQLKQLREMLIPMRAELSRISYRTEPVRDLAGSVVKLRRNFDSLPGALPSAPTAASAESARPIGEGGPLSPGLIPTFKPASSSTEASAGRIAAARTDDPNTAEKFEALLDGSPDAAPARPEMLAVTTPEFGARMAAYADVTMARPETATVGLSKRFAYLVVDDAAFVGGNWFGADSAANIEQYLKLRDLINRANAQGLVTVYVSRTNRSKHLTAELQNMCRIVLADHLEAAGADTALPVVVRNLLEDVKPRGVDS